MSFIDLTGQTFTRLTVLKFAGISQVLPKGALFECLCVCGNIKIISSNSLRSRTTVSCGCLKAERARKHIRNHAGPTTHGKSKTREARIWRMMKYRCNTPTSTGYDLYGGRGIRVCERWASSFENFLEDMGEAPSDKHTIDRIDYNSNYSPDNCRWATRREQANNRRNNMNVEYQGRTQTVAMWTKELGLPRTLIYDRLRRGWTISESFTVPIDCKHKKRAALIA